MNSLFLLLGAGIILVFGYRYFSRYLLVSVFRIDSAGHTPDSNTPTSIATRWARADARPAELMAFHFAAVAGPSTVTGVGIAVYWGWVPAFLWLVIGSAVAAGTFTMGSLWLRGIQPDIGLLAMLSNKLNRVFLPFAAVVMLVLLTGLSALIAFLSARILSAFPDLIAPLLVVIGIALGLPRFRRDRATHLASVLPMWLLAVLLVLLSIWITTGMTLGFSGALNLDWRGRSLLTVDGPFVWLVLMLLFSVFTQRRGFSDLQKHFGILTSAMAVVLMLVFLVGLAIYHPPLTAPRFTETTGPGVLPWLVVTVVSGAFAGFHFLIAYGVTGRHLGAIKDSRPVGYGAVMLELILALTALLVFAAAIGTTGAWKSFYGNWERLPGNAEMLGHYVSGLVNVSSHTGISPPLIEGLAALVLICLGLTSLMALLRVLRELLQESGQRSRRLEYLAQGHHGDWVAFGLILLLAVANGRGSTGLAVEPILAPLGYLLAGLAVLLMLVQRDQWQPPEPVLAGLFVLAMIAGLAGLGGMILEWYRQYAFGRLAGGLLLLALYLGLIAETLRQWVQHRKTTPDA